MGKIKQCPNCNEENSSERYFCKNCGEFLYKDMFDDKTVYEEEGIKLGRILENLKHIPCLIDNAMTKNTLNYMQEAERCKALLNLPEMQGETSVIEKIDEFLDICRNPEFQIAFVGTIKTGKSTLINALLGHNYASMSVTPETAALTRFRSSTEDYIHVTFYSPNEWQTLWASRTSGADAFMNEYKELNADKVKDKWIGSKPIHKKVLNSEIEKELAIWSSSKSAEHYFVKEIEVGISSLPDDFPKEVVFVDTPGLSDPVAYRSEITKKYIRKANAVFVCIDAQKVQKEEIETISSVFSFSAHNKDKVHIVATHWDKLNHPIGDWDKQKEWLEKQLVGKGFFETKEMAHANILHAAAYIYNLCREYGSLEKNDKNNLFSFALNMEIVDFENAPNLGDFLPKIKRYTNIDEIKRLLTDKLVKKYQELLEQDIEKKYSDMVYSIKRIALEKKQAEKSLIETADLDLQKIRNKIKEQERNADELEKYKQQLTKVLKSVEITTEKRLTSILRELEKIEGAEANKKTRKSGR